MRYSYRLRDLRARAPRGEGFFAPDRFESQIKNEISANVKSIQIPPATTIRSRVCGETLESIITSWVMEYPCST